MRYGMLIIMWLALVLGACSSSASPASDAQPTSDIATPTSSPNAKPTSTPSPASLPVEATLLPPTPSLPTPNASLSVVPASSPTLAPTVTPVPSPTPDAVPQMGTIRGILTDVRNRSLRRMDSITVMTEDKGEVTFESGGKRFPGFDPVHLFAHMSQGLVIVVEFHQEDGVLLIDSLSD